MNLDKRQIIDKIKEIVDQFNFFLIDVNFRGDERNRIIEIFIDNERGVTTEDCTNLSREIGSVFDSQGLIVSKYRLDVSSPGVERPLIYIQQFPKHINRKFEVEYKNGDNIEKFQGKLVSINKALLKFNVGGNETEVNFNDLNSAKVLISF